MRPISLTMTAFGSYAEKTTVDFDRLTHGLYLITGDTGAGKTTIFDAIMFALYGTASGLDRKPDMLHCDFVDKSVDTNVVLTFREGGREYTVTRTIHYPKVRGEAGQFGPGKTEAVLQEPERDPTEGASKVTDRCTELLGLNAEQFRKIVMLAQGEFKEFLKANSDKKSEILGRLFDNSVYVQYQELLNGAREMLRRERSIHTSCVEETMQAGFQDLEDTQRDRFLPEHPELVKNLAALTAADEQRLRDLEQEREQYRRQENQLIVQKGAADGQNRLLDELAAKRERLAVLEGQAEENARLQTDCEAAETVLHQIRPKQELLEGAEQRLRRAKVEITQLRDALAAQEEAVRAAQAAVDADGTAKEEIEALSLAVQTLEQTLPDYKKLDDKQAEKQREEARARTNRERCAAFQAQLERETAALEKLAAEQELLAGIDAQVVELENRCAEAQGRTAALAGETGIGTRVSGIIQEEQTLAEQLDVLRTLTETARAAEQRHHQLYQAFLQGQAGLIARDLEEELTVHGSAVCPVCHSEFCAGQAHSFAVLSDETPAQAEVDRAKRDYEAKERSRGEQDKTVTGLQTSIQKEKESILRDAKQLLPDCGGWEALAAEGYLPQAIAQFQREEADRKAAWEEAVQKQSRRDELAIQHSEKEACLEELAARISALEAEQNGSELLVRVLDESIAELQNQLRYPNKAAADEQIQLQKERRDHLSSQIARHQEQLDSARQTRDTISGNLSGKQADLPGLEQARADAEAVRTRVLAQNGFGTPEDAERALLPLEGRDGEGWLKEQRAGLTAYYKELETTQERVRELADQLGDTVYTDLAALQEQIDQLAAAYQQANEACLDQEKRLERHRAAAEKVSQAKKALEQTQPAWVRLDRLAALAMGASGEGGKLSFDRYVMGTVFQEILEMANRRLNLMSGGRYELIHQVSAGRQNAKAGLEVEVLDMSTGKQRNSASLSGGESFLVSLSLALGLSDVVQNHAGGKRLDALFIDEGFGSLDNSTLDTALDVLNQLTQGDCLVGIISHVTKLEESIPQKIRVKNGERGSSLLFE